MYPLLALILPSVYALECSTQISLLPINKNSPTTSEEKIHPIFLLSKDSLNNSPLESPSLNTGE
jgi:hypothetical protein